MEFSYLERQIPDPSGAQLPVLVLIHGRGDSPENFIHLSDGVTTPRRELALRGLHPVAMGPVQGWEWFGTMATDPNRDKLARDIIAACDAVAQGLQTLNHQEGLPERRFVVSGFSQGGMLTYALALRHPELVHHAVPIAGLLPPFARPTLESTADRPPIDALHGLDDPMVPAAQAQELCDRLKAQGYPVTYSEYSGVEHCVSPEMLRDYERALVRGLEA